MGGSQSSQFVPEVDRPGGTSLAPPPLEQQQEQQQRQQPRRLQRREQPQPQPQQQAQAQSSSPQLGGDDLRRQLQLTTTRLRNCVAHANELDARYHRDVHELKYQLALREEEAEEAAKAYSTLQLVAGGAGLALLCAAGAGAMVARRSISAERVVAKELGASCEKSKAATPSSTLTPWLRGCRAENHRAKGVGVARD